MIQYFSNSAISFVHEFCEMLFMIITKQNYLNFSRNVEFILEIRKFSNYRTLLFSRFEKIKFSNGNSICTCRHIKNATVHFSCSCCADDGHGWTTESARFDVVNTINTKMRTRHATGTGKATPAAIFNVVKCVCVRVVLLVSGCLRCAPVNACTPSFRLFNADVLLRSLC